MPLIRATLVAEAGAYHSPRTRLPQSDAVVSVYGENMRQVTWVLIDEIKSGFFGAGGHGYTTEEIQAAMAAEPALKG